MERITEEHSEEQHNDGKLKRTWQLRIAKRLTECRSKSFDGAIEQKGDFEWSQQVDSIDSEVWIIEIKFSEFDLKSVLKLVCIACIISFVSGKWADESSESTGRSVRLIRMFFSVEVTGGYQSERSRLLVLELKSVQLKPCTSRLSSGVWSASGVCSANVRNSCIRS